jgi:predicted RNase H-like nuclease
VIGVDGCRNGWVAAMLDRRSKVVNVAVAPDFAALLSRFQPTAAMIIVDMQIGLKDEGRRECERLARARLGRTRSSSVFPAPRRPMLSFSDYAAANAWGKTQGPGCGLTQQAWRILPKIREIDDAITPAHQARLGEGHPEVAFWRLNGSTPCAHRKRSSEGKRERLAILERNGLTGVDELVADARAQAKAIGASAARDDVYDACALALTARARLEGRALRLSADERDARGLLMEIWG